MKNTPKRLKQKSLLGYFEQSSPPRPETTPSRRAPQPSPTRKRASVKVRAQESDPLSERESGNTSSDVGGIDFEKEVVEISSEEDDKDDSPRRPKATQRKTRQRRVDSAEGTPDMSSSADEEKEIGVPVTWKGILKDTKGKRKRTVLDSDSEDLPRHKPKLIKGERPPTPEEKDEDLINEVDEESWLACIVFSYLIH
jgi:hypothetical protein